MDFNLLDSVKGLISGDLVSKIASSLGESQGGVEKAISGSIPTVLTGLLNHAGTQGGGANILNMATQASQSGLLGNLEGMLGGNSAGSGIAGMASNLFGDKFAGISRMISGFSGINESSASSVLGMIAPAALAALGGHAVANNLGAQGVTDLLHSQKDSIVNSVPAGLNVASALGHNSLSDISGKLQGMVSSASSNIKAAAANAGHVVQEAEQKAGGMKFLAPILIGLVLLGLLYFLLKGCNKSGGNAVVDSTKAMVDTAKAVVKSVDTAKVSAPVSMKVKLPNGTELDAYKGGIEDRLVAFLGTDYKKLGADSLKKIWFDFDNLNFKTGSAELTPESQKQVDNITAILKAFPDVKLKVGGYTDKVGVEAANVKLSQSRADRVKADLEKSGVGKQITEAQGYGSEFAKFPATAPEADRVKDRHVSVSVRM